VHMHRYGPIYGPLDESEIINGTECVRRFIDVRESKPNYKLA
jgi:hypothetical protein